MAVTWTTRQVLRSTFPPANGPPAQTPAIGAPTAACPRTPASWPAGMAGSPPPSCVITKMCICSGALQWPIRVSTVFVGSSALPTLTRCWYLPLSAGAAFVGAMTSPAAVTSQIGTTAGPQAKKHLKISLKPFSNSDSICV
eukprot:6461993-Amphidinium_carterae.1